jgi:N-acetylneuraminic acid mutarotase
MPTATWDLAAAAVNGKIYAIGGLFSYNLVANDVNIVEVYDPSTNTWTTAAPMPTARHFLTAAAVNGKIYAIGGTVNQTGNILSTVEVYDPSANSWSTAASMPTARFGLAAAVVNGKIYAIGGQGLYSGSPVNLSTVEAYDPSTNTWTTAPSMPTARYGLAAAAVNGNIYAIGGISNNGYSNVVEVDDLFTNTWTTAASIPTSAEAYLAATDANGLIYAMGGAFLNGFLVPTNSVEQYSPPVTLYTFIKN